MLQAHAQHCRHAPRHKRSLAYASSAPASRLRVSAQRLDAATDDGSFARFASSSGWVQEEYICSGSSSLGADCPMLGPNGQVNASELRLPAGMNLLAFGPSWMNQLVDATLAANAFAQKQDVLVEKLAELYPSEDGHGCDTYQDMICRNKNCFAKYVFDNSASLTRVSNYDRMHRGGLDALDRLRRLAERQHFTHVAYMVPHNRDYFEIQCCKQQGGCNEELQRRVALQNKSSHQMWCESSMGTSGYLACVKSLPTWQILEQAMAKRNGKIMLVLPWFFHELEPGATGHANMSGRLFETNPIAKRFGCARSMASERPTGLVPAAYDVQNIAENHFWANQQYTHECLVASDDAGRTVLGSPSAMAATLLRELAQAPLDNDPKP